MSDHAEGDPLFPDATESMNHAMSLDGDPQTLAKFYDEWARSYDNDIAEDYLSPQMIVQTLTRAIDSDESLTWAKAHDVKILDAGCGTGLTGLALAEFGYTKIDGVDLSAEMIGQAQNTGAYRKLESGFDLTRPAPSAFARAYDVVTIAGVFTVGHVPPSALRNVAEMVRPGGLVIASTRVAYYQSTNYQEVSDAMEVAGQLQLVHKIENGPYTMDSTAHYWAYRVSQ